jgi:hypothetical protein
VFILSEIKVSNFALLKLQGKGIFSFCNILKNRVVKDKIIFIFALAKRKCFAGTTSSLAQLVRASDC